ncbi:hypothetical protein [Paenibacillus aquistagni]|uniref:Uncharacterized protein n=1 Tax=Paenibacillus aquistagni TaxID=1852522 RepID=A0A1X7KWB8_9BACL|nr:hypothetical protein [Paenibacillus aquistagni]SMG45861.1 hypothetical protein SAMN06295960_2788 [Paenibacillus aquistagni]
MAGKKKWISVLLSVSLISSLWTAVDVPLVSAQAKNTTNNSQMNYSLPVLKKVSFNSNAYIEVNDAQFYHVEGDKYVYFTVTVHNNGSSSLNLMDYWFNIKSNTGEKYSIQLQGISEKKDNLISPKTKKTFKIYSKVNPKLNLYNLSLSVIKWDFSQPGFEKNIGSIQIPKNYSNVTPIGKNRTLNLGSNSIVTTASALQLVKTGNNIEAMVSMYVHNTGESTAQIENYKYYIKTNTNQYFELEPDAGDISVQPNEKIKVNFYAKLPNDIKASHYQLFISEEQGSEVKLKIPVASYALMIRDVKNTVTAAGKPYTQTVDNQPIEITTTDMLIDSNSEYNNITINFTMLNKGKKAVKIPDFQYELLTNNLSSYPFEKEETTGELLPGIKQEFTLKASIPSDANLDQLKLAIRKKPEENKRNDYLLAQLSLKNTTEISKEPKTTYINKQGTYEIKVEDFERVPWDTNDIVNSTITVKNTGSSTQPMLDLGISTWMNGIKNDEKDVHILKVEETLALKPGESAKLVVTTKVSNQAKFDKMRMQLTEKIDGKSKNTIANFTLDTQTAVLPTYDPLSTSAYTLDQPGVKAELKVLETNTFVGNNNNTIQSLLAYKNIGNRYSMLPNVVAFYMSEAGLLIPAKITLSDTPISPSGVNLIAVTAEVPSSIKAKDLKLLVGQGIAEGKYTLGTAKADSMVNAAKLGLADDQDKLASLFVPLELRPYTFKINSINTKTNNNGQVQFNFEYNLSQYNPFNEILNQRKLVLEIEYNGKKFAKTYSLGEANNGLNVGEKIKEVMDINDPAMSDVIYNGFTFNIYEEVNNAKKLLLTHYVSSFHVED